jgi:hypothetical protein
MHPDFHAAIRQFPGSLQVLDLCPCPFNGLEGFATIARIVVIAGGGDVELGGGCGVRNSQKQHGE